MSGKDVLRLLLISYGFCRDLNIKTYTGEGGWIGYEVTARNDDDLFYYEADCEGLLFHIYKIQQFMKENHVVPRILGAFNHTKELLSDESLRVILLRPENKDYCRTNPYRPMKV